MDFLLYDDPKRLPSFRDASTFLDLLRNPLLFFRALVDLMLLLLYQRDVTLTKSSTKVCQGWENCRIAVRLDATQSSLWGVLHVACPLIPFDLLSEMALDLWTPHYWDSRCSALQKPLAYSTAPAASSLQSVYTVVP